MASAPWTEADLAFLERLADRRDWLGEAQQRFPDRSVAAIRCKMQKVRLDGGMTDKRFVDAPWMANAVTGTTRLLEALERTGLRPV